MIKYAIVLLATAIAVPAAAVVPNAVKVGGTTTIRATMNGAQTNFALGDKNRQFNGNGVVYEGYESGGDTNITAEMNGAQTNFALGDKNSQSNMNGTASAPKN